MQCPSCGHHLPRGMMICPKCGMSLPYNVFEPENEQEVHPISGRTSEDATLVVTDFARDKGEQPLLQQAAHAEQYPLFGEDVDSSDERQAFIDTSYGLSALASPAQPPEQAEVFVPVMVPVEAQAEQFASTTLTARTAVSDEQFVHDIVVTESSVPPPMIVVPHPMPLSSQQASVTARIPSPALKPVPPAKMRAPLRLSRPMLMLLTVVAVLLIVSGSSLIYYTEVAHPAQLRAQATATAQVIQTREARATATAVAQVTATAQAITYATATAQAQARATTTALQNIYTQATNGSPALLSSLAYQDGNNWDVYATVDGGGCAFSNGTLTASVLTKGYYVPCMEHASNYTSFAFQVQMVLLKGDDGGLIFRANDTNSQYYMFSIGSNGSFSAYVTQSSTHGHTLVYDTSSAIKTGSGQMNTLTVVARASDFYFYINGQYVGSTSDSTLTSGLVGVFADDSQGNNTSIAFSNAKVWIL